MKALYLKILLPHWFSTFFPFHILQLCSYIGKFLIHIRHWDQNKQKSPLFIPIPCLLYFTEFSEPLFIKTPPFIRDLRIPIKEQLKAFNKTFTFQNASADKFASIIERINTKKLQNVMVNLLDNLKI